jgi:hypothetical protein
MQGRFSISVSRISQRQMGRRAHGPPPLILARGTLFFAQGLRRVDIAAIIPCRSIVRIDRQGLVEALQRILGAIQLPQDVAAIVQQFGRLRFDRQGLFETRQRVPVTIEGDQDETVVRQGTRFIGLCFQRPADQIRRFGVAALLMSKNSEKVLRFEMIGIPLQNFQIQTFGRRKTSRLMKRDGLIDRLGQHGWRFVFHVRYNRKAHRPASFKGQRSVRGMSLFGPWVR